MRNRFPSHTAWANAAIKRDMWGCFLFLCDDSALKRRRSRSWPVWAVWVCVCVVGGWWGEMATCIYPPPTPTHPLLILSEEKKLTLQHQNRLKAFLMSRDGFGMSGPFSVPFSSENGRRPSCGTGEKLLLFCDVAVIRKKRDPLQDLLPRTPWLQYSGRALNHNASLRWLQRACWAPNAASFILIHSHAFMYGLTSAWAGC